MSLPTFTDQFGLKGAGLFRRQRRWRFLAAPSNKVQDSGHPDLRPNSTLDFLFKSCKMEFKDSLAPLDQLRERRAKREQR